MVGRRTAVGWMERRRTNLIQKVVQHVSPVPVPGWMRYVFFFQSVPWSGAPSVNALEPSMWRKSEVMISQAPCAACSQVVFPVAR